MKVLVLPLPDLTHVNSFRHLINRLADFGHDCTIYIKEEHEHLIDKSNYTVKYYDKYFIDNIFYLNKNLRKNTDSLPYDKDKLTLDNIESNCDGYMASYVFRIRCMKKYLKTSEDFSCYDLVLYDHNLIFGDYISKVYGIPSVTLIPSWSPTEKCREENLIAYINMLYFSNIYDDTFEEKDIKEKIITSLDKMSEKISSLTKTPYDFFQSGISKLNVFSTSKELYPYGYDENKVAFIGRDIKDSHEKTYKKDHKKKKIMFYFGKIETNEQLELFRCILQNLKSLPYEIHAAIRNRNEEQYLDEDMRKTIILDEKLSENLPEMDLYICHGGLGGLQESIIEGVPIIGIGTSGERFEYIKRIDQLGLGKSISPDCESINRCLNKTIEEVLNCEDFRKKCETYGKSLMINENDLDNVIRKILNVPKLIYGRD